MNEIKLNVYQKIIKVKEVAGNFSKEPKKPGLSYRYVSGTQVLEKITDTMNEIGLLFMPVGSEHRSSRQYDYTSGNGKEHTDFIVEGSLTYAWINADDPTDRQEIPFQYYGQQDDISKAFGSALTYSERYLILKSLGLPTDEDDPDARPTDDKHPAKAKDDYQPESKQEVPQKKYGLLKDLCKSYDVPFDKALLRIDSVYGKKVNDLNDDEWTFVTNSIKGLPNGEAQMQ